MNQRLRRESLCLQPQTKSGAQIELPGFQSECPRRTRGCCRPCIAALATQRAIAVSMSRSPAAWATLARAVDVAPLRMFPFQSTRAGSPTCMARASVSIRQNSPQGGSSDRASRFLGEVLPTFRRQWQSGPLKPGRCPGYLRTIATQPCGLIPLRCLGKEDSASPRTRRKTSPSSKSHAGARCRQPRSGSSNL